MAKKGGLGRGLNSLFEQNSVESGENTVTLKLSEIEPNRNQPRKVFDEASISELADSILLHGLIQPLLVRPILGGGYQIVAGERRFRACRMAGLTDVPVIIRDLSDKETAEIALIENLQREDLNPVEEAKGYKHLMDSYSATQDEVAKIVGKSRPVIANSLRILALPDDILDKVSEGLISSGHARSLLSFKDEDAMRAAAQLAEDGKVTVRDLEKMAKLSQASASNKPESKPVKKVPFYREAEMSLSEFLGRKVSIKSDRKDKGVLQLEFYGEDDLRQLLSSFENK